MPKTNKYVIIFLGLASLLWFLSAWFIVDARLLSDINKNLQEDQRNLASKADYLSGNISAYLQQIRNIPQSVSKEANVLKVLTSAVVTKNAASLTVEQRKKIWSEELLLQATNHYLERLTDYMNASVIYVLDASGKCVLSSNAYKEPSFVGTDYQTREYFSAAVEKGNGYQYAMGSISNLPGLYFSTRITDHGNLIGVAVVKVNLSDLSPWITKTRSYLTDEYGVVILAYDKDLEMRSVPDSRINMFSEENLLHRYKRHVFPALAINQWDANDFPLLNRFGSSEQPLLIADSPVQPELVLHATQSVHQLSDLSSRRIQLFALLSMSGLLILSLAMWRFVTVRHRSLIEKEIENNEARLKTAQEIAQVGSFEWDLQSGDLKWSDEHFRLWGLEPASVTPCYKVFKNHLHPEDVTKTEEILQRALDGDGHYDCEHRVVWPDGSERHIHGRGEVTFDNGGDAVRMSGTVQDITERKQTELELILARNDAERANQAKTEFLSSMSHELRTPMNAILGFGQILDMDNHLQPEQKQSVQEILKGGSHLLQLINEVLNLSKIESGLISISSESITIEPVIKECLALISNVADKRNIQISYLEHDNVIVCADRIRLKQALLNLLSNAVKYNHDGGHVSIKICPEGTDRIRLQISDTGQGIPSERLNELFQPFSRLGAENGIIEGTGIGLTITRRIVEMMGGTVNVESEFGVGSTFWIELPLVPLNGH